MCVCVCVSVDALLTVHSENMCFAVPTFLFGNLQVIVPWFVAECTSSRDSQGKNNLCVAFLWLEWRSCVFVYVCVQMHACLCAFLCGLFMMGPVGGVGGIHVCICMRLSGLCFHLCAYVFVCVSLCVCACVCVCVCVWEREREREREREHPWLYEMLAFVSNIGTLFHFYFVKDTALSRLWFKQDDIFLKPKACISFDFARWVSFLFQTADNCKP